MNDCYYGPLATLIGTWQGNKGSDVAPEPDGSEKTPYRETITFSEVGDVTNAEQQNLCVLHYRQQVQSEIDDDTIHDQTGYWMWDCENKTIMCSVTIPRAVSVIAGGYCSGKKTENGDLVLAVSASIDDKDWQIVQAPFMRDNAKTTNFEYRATINGDRLEYSQTIMLDIYGKTFEHTDTNQLIRQK